MSGDFPTAVREAIHDWLDDNEPLSRAEFDRRNSGLIRTVGEPAQHPEYGRNQHLRATDAQAAGLFAYDHDVALAELDDDVEYVDLHGYAVDDGYVPVLICLAGEIDDVAERQHRLYHLIDDTSPCGCRAVTDGGSVDRETIERYIHNHPDADRWQVLTKLGLPPSQQELVDELLEETQENDISKCGLSDRSDRSDDLNETIPTKERNADIDTDRLAEARAVVDEDPADIDIVDPSSVAAEPTAAAFMGGDDSPFATTDTTPDRSPETPSTNSGIAMPTSVLPIAQLEATPPLERRRAARKRGLSWPTTEQLRDRLGESIREVIRHEDMRVVDAPTSAGKSYTIDSTRWGARDDLTDERPVVHLLPTRDARDEAAEVARQEGGEHFMFRARHEACPVAAGDYDPQPDTEDDDDEDEPSLELTIDGQPASEWIQEMCEGRGVAFSEAHRWLENHNDQGVSLPCSDEGLYSGECDAIAQWTDWRENDYPLVIATHNFAHVPGLRNRTNMVIDEEPDFSHELSTERVKQAIAAFLEEVDAHLDTWEEFWSVATAENPAHRLTELHTGEDVHTVARKQGLVVSEYKDSLLEELREQLERHPGREWFFNESRAHTLAGPLARAILTSEPRAGGRRVGKTDYEPVRLDADASDDDGWNREWLTVVFNSRNELQTAWSTPDVGLARSVIGLDAHPALPLWQLQVHPNIQPRRVLDVEERQLWRRFERGLRVVQVGDATRPLASGRYFNVQQTEAIVEHLCDEYGDDFQTAITTAAVEDDLEAIMREFGVNDPETMHYGEEKSRNDFADEEIGYVLGALDPGDGMVMDVVAALDLDAEPERSDPEDCDEEASAHCAECDGDGCHDCHGTGLKRARGREFVGQDAETAEAILASVRENHVAQSAGRYARNPDDPSSTATVFVETDAMPVGFADVQTPGTIQTWTPKQRAVLEALRESTTARSARELASEADVSKQHAYETLERAVEYDIVDALEGVGEHGATLYAEDGLPTSGVVDIDVDAEIVKDHVQDPTYTWSLAIRDPTQTETAVRGGDRDITGRDEVVADGDDPPDDR